MIDVAKHRPCLLCTLLRFDVKATIRLGVSEKGYGGKIEPGSIGVARVSCAPPVNKNYRVCSEE